MSCITLLSDLGLHDASVAVAKGVLMQHNNDSLVIDISHEVAPFNIRQAAYLLASAWKNFPEGSAHLILFDIFSEKTPRLILSIHNGHYFLAPDNGIVPLALGMIPADTYECMELTPAHSYTDWLSTASSVIHHVQQPSPQLPGTKSLVPKSLPGLQPEGNDTAVIVCEAIHIDQYENVVLNIRKEQFETIRQGRAFRLRFMLVEEITDINVSYRDVRPGFKLCRFNSSGFMEICINRGRAASLFGIKLGGKHNDIKILFE